MKKYIPLSLALGSALFAANVFADQLKFGSDVVSANTVGSVSPTATLTSTAGGTPTSTLVILPKTLAIKDLKTGDVVFLPAPRNSVFRIINVTPGPDGSVLVDVEDTFLTVKPTGKTSSTTTTTTTVTPPPATTTPPNGTTPPMTMPMPTAPAKTGGY